MPPIYAESNAGRMRIKATVARTVTIRRGRLIRRIRVVKRRRIVFLFLVHGEAIKCFYFNTYLVFEQGGRHYISSSKGGWRLRRRRVVRFRSRSRSLPSPEQDQGQPSRVNAAR